MVADFEGYWRFLFSVKGEVDLPIHVEVVYGSYQWVEEPVKRDDLDQPALDNAVEGSVYIIRQEGGSGGIRSSGQLAGFPFFPLSFLCGCEVAHQGLNPRPLGY